MRGNPFVTCLILTRNRRHWLPCAIQSAQYQTYKNREILIVADGDSVADLVPNDPSIRLVQLDRYLEIGPKRNLGCSHARGGIIANWDDDDWSHPERLADQIARLIASGKDVTGYDAMRFTDGTNWWQFWAPRNVVGVGRPLGTSLVFRKEWWMRNPFPSVHVGEDGTFADVAREQNALITTEAGELMYATIHPENTSPRDLLYVNHPQWRQL